MQIVPPGKGPLERPDILRRDAFAALLPYVARLFLHREDTDVRQSRWHVKDRLKVMPSGKVVVGDVAELELRRRDVVTSGA